MEISAYVFPTGELSDWVDEIVAAEALGYRRAWAPQLFGWDALTALALAATRTTRLGLGTAVVPSYPRHPLVLAQAALTTQAVSAGRLTLGVGLAHAFVVEGMWGYSYSKPAAWMDEYLSALLPVLAGEAVAFEGERVVARSQPLRTPGVDAPRVLLAAMAPRMLRLAGGRCAGTVTWMTGVQTLRDHIIPSVHQAASDAGRPEPAVVAGLPVCVTANARTARATAGEQFDVYRNVPAYRAMLDREGADGPADVAIIGSRAEVAAALDALEEAGVTEFMACVFGTADERSATHALLGTRLGAAL